MSVGEADRAAVMRDVAEKRLRQREAAERLGLSVRQVKLLLARYRERGPSGLVSGHRGKVSNNAIAKAARREAMELVRERYPDFGPTFAREKLVEEHGHRLSVETLRQWMIADGLWRAKARRTTRVHQSRPRRECVGDLVQIDGSPHAWFEDRGPACALIVYVDDATTRRRWSSGRGRPTSRRRTIPGGGRRMRAAASAGRRAVDLWTSPADRRAPFGACGQPVDNALGRVAIDRAFRRALPTGCPHSRAS